MGSRREDSRRPFIVFLPPQSTVLNDADVPVEERPWVGRWHDGVFAAEGVDYEFIYPGRFPWNPFARMHNAYAGLDPLRALRVLLFRRRASAVVAYTESPSLPLLLLRRLFRFRPPVLLWEVQWSEGWAWRDWLSAHTIPYADRCVVYGTNQIALLDAKYGGRPRSVFQPFSIDVEFFSPRPGIPGERPVVLSVGLDHGRDFASLVAATEGLEATVRIKAGRHPVQFDRAARANVELIEAHLSHVAFRQLYADAAVVAVTTFDTPNACGVTSLLEAMAMARPIVVSDNPALRDYIPGPDACIAVPIGDRAALRAAIERLLADPAAAAEMGRRARAHLLAHHHPSHSVRRIIEICRDAAREAGTAPPGW